MSKLSDSRNTETAKMSTARISLMKEQRKPGGASVCANADHKQKLGIGFCNYVLPLLKASIAGVPNATEHC